MATGWVKSLHCKSRSIEDVFLPNPKRPPNQFGALSSSCRKSAQSLKDAVMDTTVKKTHKKPIKSPPPSDHPHRSSSRSSTSSLTMTRSSPVFPALTELPDGHPSRKVVEIIFHSSWHPKEEFSGRGRIEMLFKVQNLQKTVARFEEYREIVKSRALALTCSAARDREEEDVARCVADGNEVMRFHCLGAPRAGAMCEALWRFSGKEAAVWTYSGSGAAHDRGGGGGGKGRRAMLVCRVIAGRVCNNNKLGFDSVGGENGELLVLDSRAVLPCFLIIYKTLV
ncbi:hypothetical protein Sjap_020422 [Stephania japonica]|uniref:Uncharacterized protein n=1 Tax=Stephania japonica TaxID=461633 RepID=A0AAP0HVK0_9MAGN